ncbi:MAG: hypothetical protein ACYSVY_25055, partial [Planctomycetota bacterium]
TTGNGTLTFDAATDCTITQVDGQTVTVSCSGVVSDLTDCVATVEFTVDADDCCGNSGTQATCQADVDDVIPPDISCEATQAVYEVDGNCDATVQFDATVTDNCCVNTADVTPSMTETTGNGTLTFDAATDCTITQVDGQTVTVSCSGLVSDLTDCPATVEFTVDADDCCGNSGTQATCQADVDDEIPPTVSCPDNQELTCGVEFCFTATADDNCDPDPAIDCAVIAASDPTRVEFVPQAGNGEFCVTLTASATATIECTATDICTNGSDPCTFDVSATCNQACSPGFWRNNLDEWCNFTPFNPFDNFCGAGLSATLFVDAFEFVCPGGCTSGEIPASFDPATLTLHDAVNTSGGSFNQALFHGSAALLSSYAVSFPVGPQAVLDVMQDAFDGTITFTQAFNQFATWNAAENEGGCPLDGSPPPSAPPTLESTVDGGG